MRLQFTPRFRNALSTSGRTHADMARAVGLAPSRFSTYVCGSTFGPQTARRIVAIGRLLGLDDPASCCEQFVDPLAEKARS
jgi:hypothetical protein